MILFALAAAAAQPAETPRRFLDSVYARYRQSDFSPFTHPGRYFAPRLVAAIAEDSRLAHGDVGYLDGDPLCQCQDASGLHSRIASVRITGTGRAAAEVILDYPDNTPTRVRLNLVRTKLGWRIADVSSGDEPSLMRSLQQSNAKARAQR
jgi:hypothetical protein